jgi:5-methyltetrahydrofolate corrinoid/iron sulfur protein methyltransferase
MIIIADNLTASRPSVLQAIENRDAEAIASLCEKLHLAGADWIDLNPGYVKKARREEVWRFLIHTVEQACSQKLVLDSPEPETLAMALEHCTRAPMLNMATAQPERYGPIFDLAAANGLEVSAACITQTVPLTSDERLSLAALLVSEAASRGISGEQLLLDPMVMPLGLSGGEMHASAVIQTLRALPYLFDQAPRSLMALSNLYTKTAGVDTKSAAQPFLCAAWGAGLDAVMLDVLDEELMDCINLLRTFAGRAIFSGADAAK